MALLLTIIGRIVDGLPLAASMPSDEQVSSLTSFSFFFKGVRLGSLVKLHCFQLTFSRLEPVWKESAFSPRSRERKH